jgi:shikimate kinase / 3-dehydroquinate synthase
MAAMRRPLFLNGFMASGKSALGRRVADLAGLPFEDLDRSIEDATGRSIAELFELAGEAEFRRMERAALERALGDASPRVVALGGGTLLEREPRLCALEHAVVVTLEAPLDVLLSRAAASDDRPLLTGDEGGGRARALLESRAPAYAEAHARIDTSRFDLEATARAALAVWQRDPVAVAAGERSYAVDVAARALATRLPELVGAPSGVLLVSDENVARLHGQAALSAIGQGSSMLVLRPGEAQKTVAAAEQVWRAAHQAALDRAGLVVALGGGVVSDVAGFGAATWLRGVPWLALPTTLLAMVDASVGGKTAVDFADAKNAVGTFWQPRAVYAELDFLATEPERGYRSALAEVVKTGLIGDPELIDLLEAQADAVLARDRELLVSIVRRCVAVKARIVSRDERESDLRMTLNLGHTLGHALEAASGFSRYSHGEAVSLGMIAALDLGVGLGVTPAPLAARVRELCTRLGLPVQRHDAPLHDALALLARDKKRRGTYIHFVVVHEPGRAAALRLEIGEIQRGLAGP